MSTLHSKPLLSLRSVEAGYVGGVRVLSGIELDVVQGEIVALLGRNGAGKTTAIRIISGLLKPFAGTIEFAGSDITGADPADVVRAGIAAVPEGRRVFASLTVEENLAIGSFVHRTSVVPKPDFDKIYAAFPKLAERRKQKAGTLSGGEQQMVAMGRALMAKPRLLLLDEPSMGLAPMLIEAVFDMINTLAAGGMTILLIEQNASAALDLVDRAYVLERGVIVRSGDAAELQFDPEIRASYLGID